MFRVGKDGSLSSPDIKRPSMGREYRGVGFVGDCLLVMGQADGWMTCFEWNARLDRWTEREFHTPVQFSRVVDIKEVKTGN